MIANRGTPQMVYGANRFLKRRSWWHVATIGSLCLMPGCGSGTTDNGDSGSIKTQSAAIGSPQVQLRKLTRNAITQSVPQLDIPVVDQMPNLPAHGVDMNWAQKAADYDSLVMNSQNGMLTTTNQGYPSIPAYYEGSVSDNQAISILPTILGRYLINKDNSNYAGAFSQFYQASAANGGNGALLYLNNVGSSGGSFWYAIMAGYYSIALTAAYNGKYGIDPWGSLYSTANRWCDAGWYLSNTYAHEGFDFIKNVAIDGDHVEPDAPGGIAWIQYQAYLHFPNEIHFLNAAKTNISILEAYSQNPNYEGPVMNLAAYTAARLNAEQGQNFDMQKIVNWVFQSAQPGGNNAGIHVGKYGDEEINGLSGGSAANRGFSMNTYAPILGLLPMVRYDLRFATAVGKYLLNVATNARLFYTEFLSDAYEDLPGQVPPIPYESLDHSFTTAQNITYQPYGRGDAVINGWAPTDRALYGGALAAVIGGTSALTNNTEVLQWDLLKLDFQHTDTYPTYLYYNPYPSSVWINYAAGNTPVDLYELTTHTFLQRNVTGTPNFLVPAGAAYVVVVLPANSTVSTNANSQSLVNGKIIAYQ